LKTLVWGLFLTAAAPAAAQAPAAEAPKSEPKPAAGLSAEARKKALLDPKSADMKAQAPATYKVLFETTKGSFTVQVHRDWAPGGADRFYNLVRAGYYDDVRFFRVLSGFMAQFGINGDPKVNAAWRNAVIPDDAVKQSNTRGKITFATRGLNSRTTQVFINYANNSSLDAQKFSPFGEVVEGMDIVDALYSGYGEGAPRGKGPDQTRFQAEGNAYAKASFPKLDYVKRAVVLE
jgi:peptidyl-prolyl cis-trans isomerase A (cyclophilin A)